MPGFDTSLNERMTPHAQQRLGALAESWNQCFTERSGQFRVGELQPVHRDALPEPLRGPGLAMLFEEAGTGAVVLIPEACGLPGWYQTPTDSEKSRLDTLAMEWSLNLWPEDHSVERSASMAVTDLADYLVTCEPSADAVGLALELVEAEAVLGTVFVVWPVGQCQWTASPAAAVSSPLAEPEIPPPLPPPPIQRGPDPLARLRHLPVTISVRLAEKKVTLSQLLAITPGALVTFSKSCDDLLDLYVNNSLYCRGEAVKIGESFGLKIDEVGVQVERETKLLHR